MGLLERLGLRPLRCPRCRSARCESRTRTEKQYVAGEHQAYESTAGWVYGHREVLVTHRHCTACGHDFGERRKTLRAHKARGATAAKKFGGYGTE
jgi:Zn ribbon nucleic-acid-binding protein